MCAAIRISILFSPFALPRSSRYPLSHPPLSAPSSSSPTATRARYALSVRRDELHIVNYPQRIAPYQQQQR